MFSFYWSHVTILISQGALRSWNSQIEPTLGWFFGIFEVCFAMCVLFSKDGDGLLLALGHVGSHVGPKSVWSWSWADLVWTLFLTSKGVKKNAKKCKKKKKVFACKVQKASKTWKISEQTKIKFSCVPTWTTWTSWGQNRSNMDLTESKMNKNNSI